MLLKKWELFEKYFLVGGGHRISVKIDFILIISYEAVLRRGPRFILIIRLIKLFY